MLLSSQMLLGVEQLFVPEALLELGEHLWEFVFNVLRLRTLFCTTSHKHKSVSKKGASPSRVTYDQEHAI